MHLQLKNSAYAAPSQQTGIALITVLLVVALAVIVTTHMIERLQLQMQRNTNIQTNEQAYWYAMGAEAFAKTLLQQVKKKSPSITTLQQAWAQKAQSYPVDNGEISGKIIDLQACFNLNALREKTTDYSVGKKSVLRKAFESLIVNLNIEGVGQFEAEYMTDALVDWLDSNSDIVSAGGAEDSDYEAKAFPYLAANNLLASVNELRVIEHFNVTVIKKLKDFVCVIPENDQLRIDVNTVQASQAPMIAAILGTNTTVADVQEALTARSEKGFQSVDEFFQQPQFSHSKIGSDVKQYFTVNSDYFKLLSTAKFANSYFKLTSIMKIVNNQQVTVIGRTIGID